MLHCALSLRGKVAPLAAALRAATRPTATRLAVPADAALRLRSYATAAPPNSPAAPAKVPEARGAPNVTSTPNVPGPAGALSAQNSSSDGSEVLEPPEVVAKRWLSYFPFKDGPRMARSSALTLALGALVFGVSKEIIFIDEDMRRTLMMMLTFGAILHFKRDMIYSIYDEHMAERFNGLRNSRAKHRFRVENAINASKEIMNVGDATKMIYKMAHSITDLEAKAFVLKQKSDFAQGIRATLDAWVRHERNEKEKELKSIKTKLDKRFEECLSDKKFQEALLNKSIKDLEKVSVAKI